MYEVVNRPKKSLSQVSLTELRIIVTHFPVKVLNRYNKLNEWKL
jgi:hypothetical protein